VEYTPGAHQNGDSLKIAMRPITFRIKIRRYCWLGIVFLVGCGGTYNSTSNAFFGPVSQSLPCSATAGGFFGSYLVHDLERDIG
jgi:hypothetical protein